MTSDFWSIFEEIICDVRLEYLEQMCTSFYALRIQSSLTISHCLDLDMNDQKKRHYFQQWFHILKNE